MKCLFGAVAMMLATAGSQNGASAGLTAEARASVAPARGGLMLAKAKKKRRPAAPTDNADADAAPADADDGSAATSKSSSASSAASGDDAASEDELLGGAKKKKKAPRDDSDGADGGGGGAAAGDDDGAGKSAGKSVETVSSKASEEEGTPSTASALEFGVGAKALFRNFNWSTDASAAQLGPYSLTPGPETGLWLEFYPAAFGTSGFAANVGLFGSFNYGFGVTTTLANGNDVATKFSDFQGGLKVRIPLGMYVPNLSIAYGQQTFEIAQQQAMTDLPQLAYQFIRPGLGTRVLFSPTVALDVSAGYLAVLDPGSGADHVRSSRFFPNAKAYGIDASASVGFRISGAIGARAGLDWRQYGLNFNPSSTTRAVAGAVDRYIVAWAGLEVVLDGQGAGAGGDDAPVKPSRRRRRHAPEPTSDDDAGASDDSSSKSDEQ